MRTAERPVGERTDGSDRVAWAVVVVALLGIGVVYAQVRWPGLLPVGSDNDEYRIVGEALARFDAPIVAGVEGTKYPLGYPALLALFQWLGLPPAPMALVANLFAVAFSTLVTARLAGRNEPAGDADPGAALLAGGVLVTSVAVWNDAYSVMPELLLLAVVGAILAVVALGSGRRRWLLVTVLAVVAVLLKTLAALLVVGGCLGVWLWSLSRGGRRHGTEIAGRGSGSRTPGPLIPAVAAVVVVLAGMLVMRAFPTHTTGYTAVFFLREPDDASRGTLSLWDVVTRSVSDVPATFADLGRAIAFVDAGQPVAVMIAVVALSIGVVAAFRLRPGTAFGPFVAGMTLAYVAGLSAWPYHSSRFGVPLVPVAAIGAGWLVRVVTHRRKASLVVAAGAVAVLAVTSFPALQERGEAAQAALTRQHAALGELRAWAAEDLGAGEELVSFDYREIARVLDRPVQPIGYTSDPEALLEQIEGADHLVVMEFYPERITQAQIVLEAYPERFEPVHETENLEVYRVEG